MLWFLLVFWLVPSIANAALTCVDAGAVEVHENAPANPRTISYTKPAGSNQITFAFIGFREGASATISSVTQGGQSMTADTTFQYQGVIIGGNLYRLKDPPSGANDVVFTTSASVSQASFIIFTCTDTDLTSFRSFGSTKGLDTTPTITASSVSAGDIIVACMASDDTSDPTEGANQTIIHEGTTGSTNGACTYKAGADGATNSWTISSDDWVIFYYVLTPTSTDDGGAPLWFD